METQEDLRLAAAVPTARWWTHDDLPKGIGFNSPHLFRPPAITQHRRPVLTIDRQLLGTFGKVDGELHGEVVSQVLVWEASVGVGSQCWCGKEVLVWEASVGVGRRCAAFAERKATMTGLSQAGDE